MTTSRKVLLSDYEVGDKDTTAQTLHVDSEKVNALRECKEPMKTTFGKLSFSCAVAICAAVSTLAIVTLPSKGEQAIAPISEASLLNGLCNVPTVSEAGSETVQFKAGKAEWNGCTGELVKTAIGDLNGDGINDGAAIFVYNSGGSGYFTYLLVFVASEKGAQLIGDRSLGDRSRANSLKISKGTITLDLLGHRSGDGASLPTLKRLAKFKVRKNQLVGPDNLQLIGPDNLQ